MREALSRTSRGSNGRGKAAGLPLPRRFGSRRLAVGRDSRTCLRSAYATATRSGDVAADQQRADGDWRGDGDRHERECGDALGGRVLEAGDRVEEAEGQVGARRAGETRGQLLGEEEAEDGDHGGALAAGRGADEHAEHPEGCAGDDDAGDEL